MPTESAPMTPDGFRSATGVSRETLARLEAYADLLRRWQRTVNLIGTSTLPDLWRRHMLDSAQLHDHLPVTAKTLIDIGTGAGFPGMVLAIMGGPRVHLVESDQRKAAFLREAARVTGAAVDVHALRIEAMASLGADVVTARAVAPLSVLIGYAAGQIGPDGICLFLKGRQVDQELTDSAKIWHMQVDRLPSISDPSGTILRIGAITSVR